MPGLEPMLPPNARQTFEVDRPLETHWKIVDCATAALMGECNHYRDGFRLEFNPTDPELPAHRDALRAAGYRWVEDPGITNPGFLAFFFGPEQRCLRSRKMPHVVPRERIPLLRVVAGDWRARGGLIARHTRVEDFAEHLWETVDRLETTRQKG